MKKQLNVIVSLFFLLNIYVFSSEMTLVHEKGVKLFERLGKINKEKIKVNVLHKSSMHGLRMLNPNEAVKYENHKKHEDIPVIKTIVIEDKESDDLAKELIKLLPDKGGKGFSYQPIATINISKDITIAFSPQNKQVKIINTKEKTFAFFEMTKPLETLLQKFTKIRKEVKAKGVSNCLLNKK